MKRVKLTFNIRVDPVDGLPHAASKVRLRTEIMKQVPVSIMLLAASSAGLGTRSVCFENALCCGAQLLMAFWMDYPGPKGSVNNYITKEQCPDIHKRLSEYLDKHPETLSTS